MSVYVTAKVAKAFAPAEKLTPSQWAERFRVLTSTSAEPGPYRVDRTPYMRGIIDAIAEQSVRELVVMKSAQVGYTTMLQNLIGWTVDQAPGPTLFILPGKDAAKALMRETLAPLIDSCPQLQSRLRGDAHDVSVDALNFESMSLFMGSMNSPLTLQGRAIRYVYVDEADRGPADSAGMGSPIELGRSRLTTFGHRARLIIGCTPSTPDGHVAQQWAGCGDRRTFQVPCPQCSTYQQLSFGGLYYSYDDVKAIPDKPAQADHIEREGRTAYRCAACKALIPHEAKAGMLARGAWVSEGQTVDKLGNLLGDRPRAARVGFHISALYSPWVTWAQIAAKFVRAQGDRAAMQVFHNETLGEPFRESVGGAKVEELRQVPRGAPAGEVPAWASVLIASADTQDDRFYYVVRAWSREHSQLVAKGEVDTFDQLRAATLDAAYRVEGTDETLRPFSLFIDSKGHRTNEVYAFAATDARIKAVAGVRSSPVKIRTSIPAKQLDIELLTIDTNYFKDQLHGDRKARRWLLNAAADDEYLRHIAAEHKVIDHRTGVSYWDTISVGAANHYLDCETYNHAAALYARVADLPSEAEHLAQREALRRGRDEMKAAQGPANRIPEYAVAHVDPGWMGNVGGSTTWFSGRSR